MVAQLLARGSILIHLQGTRVQPGQCELTVLTSIPEDPNPIAKAVGSQAAGPSTPRGPHAAAEGDGVKQSLMPGSPHPAAGGWGQRGSSGTGCALCCFSVVWQRGSNSSEPPKLGEVG